MKYPASHLTPFPPTFPGKITCKRILNAKNSARAPAIPLSTFRMNTCESVSKQRTLSGSVDILGTEGDFLADKPGRMMFSTQAGGGMPEIGLLPFARVALDVATTVLPTYRSRFSKHQFTQPQLLAVLCLMRYEDWTFREAEVRLGEHRDLREVLQLQTVPDYTTLYRFLKRLEDDTVERGLGETVRRLRRGKTHVRVSAAIDGTGLSPQAVSTYFIRRIEQQNGGKPRYRHYLKWLVVVDVKQQVVLAQQARQGPWVDTRALPGLVDAAARRAPLRLVLADAEFDSEANHQHIRQRCGAQSIIPAQPRRGVPRGTLRSQMYRAFPQKKYGQRAKVETIFSVVKRKLSSRAPGRSLSSQIRQALLLGLTYNLYRLRHPRSHRGSQQSRLKSFVLIHFCKC